MPNNIKTKAGNLKAIKQVSVSKGMTVNQLMKEFSELGVMQAGKLGMGIDILEDMIKDEKAEVFFGQAGAMVPGGMREILIDMMEKEFVDVFVTTGATLTHDLIEALGFKHLKGSEFVSDEELNKKGLDRIYNSYMQSKGYIELEKFCHDTFAKLPEKELSSREICQALGENIGKKSIMKTCADHNIPIYCPALSDSGVGLMAWGYRAMKKKLNFSAFKDLDEILELAWEKKNKGVFYVGGGTPKNFIQQAMQFAPIPAQYGVQLTTDKAEFGGSSGAPLREGISWGKMNPNGKFVDITLDATVALPLIHAALIERMK